MAKHKRIHSRRARARRARKSRPATAAIDRLQEVSSNECLLFRRLPAFDRPALCCFPGAGTQPGFHPGEDVPGGRNPAGAFLSVNPSTRRWEYLDVTNPDFTTWLPVQEDVIHTLTHEYLPMLDCGALWVGPMAGDRPGWWGLTVDPARFLSLFWAEQVEPAPLHEPSLLARYREELSVALPGARRAETTVVLLDPEERW